MTTYTKESLEKINKRDMISIVLSLQSKLEEANKHVLEEIRKLSDAFFGISVWISCFATREFPFVKQIDQYGTSAVCK